MTIDEAKRHLAAISPNPLARPEDFNVTSVVETVTLIERDCEPRVPRFPKIASNGVSRKEIG